MKLEQLYWELTLGLLEAKGFDPAPEWSIGSGITGDAICLRHPQMGYCRPKVILPRAAGEPLFLIYGGKGIELFPGEGDGILAGEISATYEVADGVDQSEDYPEWWDRYIHRAKRVECAENFDLDRFDWVQEMLTLLS